MAYSETSSLLARWGKQEELNFLEEVSCVLRQWGLRQLQTAFTNFFGGRTTHSTFHVNEVQSPKLKTGGRRQEGIVERVLQASENRYIPTVRKDMGEVVQNLLSRPLSLKANRYVYLNVHNLCRFDGPKKSWV